MLTSTLTITETMIVDELAAHGITAVPPFTNHKVDNDLVPSTFPTLEGWAVSSSISGTDLELLLDATAFPTVGGIAGDVRNYMDLEICVTDSNGDVFRIPYEWSVLFVYTPPPNAAPTGVDDTGATNQDTALNNIDVLSNDTDPENDTLSVTGATVPAAQGTVTVNPDGTINFIPANGFTGDATITYTLSDGTNTDTADLVVTVTAQIGTTNAFANTACWRVEDRGGASGNNITTDGRVQFINAVRLDGALMLGAACYEAVDTSATQANLSLDVTSTDGQRLRARARFYDAGGAALGTGSVTWYDTLNDGPVASGGQMTGTITMPAGSAFVSLDVSNQHAAGVLSNHELTNYALSFS